MCVPLCVCVSPQTFADMEAVGSSGPQLLEEPNSEPGRGSPVSNPASANAVTNSESVSHTTDLQVCVSFSLCLSVSVLSLLTVSGQTFLKCLCCAALFLKYAF